MLGSVLAGLALLTAFAPLALIPLPAQFDPGVGTFEFTAATRWGACVDSRHIIERLANEIAPAIDWVNLDSADVRFRVDASRDDLGPEGYELLASGGRVEVVGGGTAGVFYAGQTLRQLAPIGPIGQRWTIPNGRIVDRPRYSWRGMHLDVSRHFFTVAEIKRYLDVMAMLKLNRFHWHLTDDGGWRIEITRYPRLTETGAWRVPLSRYDKHNLRFPGTYGGFYTQAEIREVVAYAAERFITVVPEIEMPGHSLAALAAYPEHLPTGHRVEGGRPTTNTFCVGRESTYHFLEGVLEEVLDLFPSRYIHIGMDEVEKSVWQSCADCSTRMRTEDLASVDELQAYFGGRVETYLRSKGRVAVAWDEAYESGAPKSKIIMGWRGERFGHAAAYAGYSVIMSPASHAYFDYPYERTPTVKVYDFRPAHPDMSPEVQARVLGGQANVWTEWLPDRRRLEFMVFPRLFALAEAVWSAPEPRSYDDFLRRLSPMFTRLDHMGLTYRIAPPIAPMSLYVIREPVELDLARPDVPGAVIRFTTNGRPPDSDSSVWTAPQTILERTRILAQSMNLSGATSELVRVDVVPLAPIDPRQLRPGIRVRIVDGEFSAAPDFARLSTFEERIQPFLDFRPFKYRVGFALEATGYLRIDRAGPYTFTLGSDDGSLLDLAGVRFIDNDGIHPYIERSAKAWLTEGYHPFRIRYFQREGFSALNLYYQSPSDSIRRQLPASHVFHMSP